MSKTKRASLAAILLCTAAAAPAQLLGGRAGVGVGAGVGVPSIGSTVGGTTRATGAVADGVVDNVKVPSVTVKAGVSTRVDRGTRCYYQPDDDYYDPVYRDGSYYCEQHGSGVGAGAAVTTRR